MLQIKSANSDACLEFSARQGDEFTVSIRAADHSGTRRVWAYTDAIGIAALFRDLAAEWRGWTGTKTWESIEGELQLSATSDRLGHITLEVLLSHDNIGNPDPWRLRSSLLLEAGQLEGVAKQAEAFFAGVGE